MNKITFSIASLLLFLFSISAKAQDKTYTETIDNTLISVDKKQMKTSILYDRVFPFANLKQIKDTTDFEYFRQACSELHRASYNPSFKNVDEIYSKLKNNKENLDVVPLGIIDASFDYFNKENIENK